MEVQNVLGEGQVAGVQDADGAVVVTAGQHETGIGTAGSEGNVQNAAFHGAANAQGNVAVAQLEALVHDATGLLTDDLLFFLHLVGGQGLLIEHVDHLLGAAQALGVGFHGGDAHGLVGGLDDDLGGLGQGCDQAAGGDDTEGLGLVRGEAAHPLVQHRGDHHVVIAVLVQVLFRQLFQSLDGGHVLAQVAALAIANANVFDTLLRGQQRLDDGDGVGDAGGHQGAGQGAVGLPVDGNAHFLIKTGEAVHILPVPDGALHGDVLAVGQVVGNAAALIAGKAAGVGDFGKQPGIGGAVADLNRHIDAFNDLAAVENAVVDSREAIEHGPAQTDGLGNAVFGLLVPVLTGVGVNGGGQQIGLAFLFQKLQQLDMLFQYGNTGTGLNQGTVVPLGVDQLLGEVAVGGHILVIGNGFFQVHILTGGPLGQNFLTLCQKFAFGNLFIFQFHIV